MMDPGHSGYRRTDFFARWARLAERRRFWVLGTAVVLIVAIGALYSVARGEFGGNITVPGTQSDELRALLLARFPENAGDPAFVVVHSSVGINDESVRPRVERLVAELQELPEVVAVVPPFGTPGAISPDGTTARITAQYRDTTYKLQASSLDALLNWRKARTSADLQVELGGPLMRRAEIAPPGSSEFIGVAAAAIILLIAFGSVVAAGVPITTALFGLVPGFLLIGIGASFVDLVSFTPQFSAMVGIGVGIDYSLLVVTRFRESLNRGMPVDDAIAYSSATGGRTVAFASATVIIALLGLWVVGIPFIAVAASGAALVVFLSALVAILVLPAVLAIVGSRIHRLSVHRKARTAATPSGPSRLARVIQRRPLAVLV